MEPSEGRTLPPQTLGLFWHSQNDPVNPYQNDSGIEVGSFDWGLFGQLPEIEGGPLDPPILNIRVSILTLVKQGLKFS